MLTPAPLAHQARHGVDLVPWRIAITPFVSCCIKVGYYRGTAWAHGFAPLASSTYPCLLLHGFAFCVSCVAAACCTEVCMVAGQSAVCTPYPIKQGSRGEQWCPCEQLQRWCRTGMASCYSIRPSNVRRTPNMQRLLKALHCNSRIEDCVPGGSTSSRQKAAYDRSVSSTRVHTASQQYARSCAVCMAVGLRSPSVQTRGTT